MKSFEFFGHSDDVFCVTGACSHEQNGSNKLTYLLRDASDGLNRVLISGEYTGQSDCWAITIEPWSEDNLPMEGWKFEYIPRNYGGQLFVSTPDDVECSIYEHQ